MTEGGVKIGDRFIEIERDTGDFTVWSGDPKRNDAGRVTATKGDPGPDYLDRVTLLPEEVLTLLDYLQGKRRTFEEAILRRAIDRVRPVR